MIKRRPLSAPRLSQKVASALASLPSEAELLTLGREVAASLPLRDPAPTPPAAALRARLAARLTESGAEGLAVRAGARVMVLLLDICALGEVEALVHNAQEILPLADAGPLMVQLAWFMDDTGVGRALSPEAVGQINARLIVEPHRLDAVAGLLRYLGLSPAAPFAARQNAFGHAALPRLREAARAGDVRLALSLERLLNEQYLKTIETPDHHRQTLARIEEAFEGLAAEPFPGPRPPRARPRVAFMMFNGAMFAHADVLLWFLSGLAELADPPIEPIVIFHASDEGGDLGERLDRLGVRWEAMSKSGGVDAAYYRQVRDRMAALEIDAAVYVSTPQYLAYFCRRPLAPVQIWWSLKFPLPNFEGLDGRVFYRTLVDREVAIDGKVWRGGPMAVAPLPPPDPAAVAAVRARFPGKTIIGTIAREEKIADEDYLRVIVDILRRHPETCFLWTGRRRLQRIEDAFRTGGVADRCHFVGWVDPATYLMAFDLFIDTFPLSGLTSAWSMAMGRTVITAGGLGFIGEHLDSVLSGEVPAPPEEVARVKVVAAALSEGLPGTAPADVAGIAAFADPLLRDPALRARIGKAQQTHMATFVADLAASAAIQARHFAEIIHETRASAA